MYVNKLGGSWMKHPFIRGSFLLTDPDDIQRILAADIKEVWIDVEKGVQSPKPKAQSQFWACLFAAQKFAHKKAPVFFIGKTGAVARQQLRQ